MEARTLRLSTLLDANTVNGAALVRRSAVEAVGGWDETMRDGLEDWDFWITLVERGYRGDIIPEILFRYRQRQDSMSRVNFAGHGHARCTDSSSRGIQSRFPATSSTWSSAAMPTWLRRGRCQTPRERDSDWRRCQRWREPAMTSSTAERRHSRWEREREIEQQRRQLSHEVAALRASLSWRLTAPLRSVGTLVNRALRRHP